MTNYYRRDRVGISVSPAATVFDVGQSIPVRVRVVARRDSVIRQARAYLAANLWYQQRRTTYTQYAAISSQPPPTTVTATSVVLDLPERLSAGDRKAYEAVVPNWATAPSGRGKDGRRLEYRVWAAVDLGVGGQAHGGTLVTIASGRSVYQEIEGAEPPPPHPAGQCDPRLVLPVRHGRPGETLGGVLRVTPRQPVRVRRVHLFLFCVTSVTTQKLASSVPYADYRRRDVRHPAAGLQRASRATLARNVGVTGPREFPFTVRLPAKASPTLVTGYLAVRWYVRARLQYGPGRAESCGREINVYTSKR